MMMMLMMEGTGGGSRGRKGGREEIGGWQEGKRGFGNSSIFPFLLDVQVPFPGQVVVLVVVGELGFNVVSAAGQHAFGCLLQGCQEFVFIRPRPITAHHVVSLVN